MDAKTEKTVAARVDGALAARIRAAASLDGLSVSDVLRRSADEWSRRRLSEALAGNPATK